MLTGIEQRQCPAFTTFWAKPSRLHSVHRNILRKDVLSRTGRMLLAGPRPGARFHNSVRGQNQHVHARAWNSVSIN